MIHPMWAEFAKVGLRMMLRDAEWEDETDRQAAIDGKSESAALIADAMCAEYNKRDVAKGSPSRDGSGA